MGQSRGGVGSALDFGVRIVVRVRVVVRFKVRVRGFVRVSVRVS